MTADFIAARCGKMAASCRGGLVRAVSRLRDDCRGAAAVEFALMTPVLLGLLVPIADLGTYVYDSMQLQLAAQAGAEYAARNDWNPTGITAAMQSAAPSLGLSTNDGNVPQNTDILPGTCMATGPTNCTQTIPGNAAFTAANVQVCGCVDNTTGNFTATNPWCPNPRPACPTGAQLQAGVYYIIGAQMRYHTLSGLQYPLISDNSLMLAWSTVRVQ